MDWFNEIKEGFIVPRTGFEPVTYGLEINCMLENKFKNYCNEIKSGWFHFLFLQELGIFYHQYLVDSHIISNP